VTISIDSQLDAGEAGCGELIMLIFKQMQHMPPGETLLVTANDLAAETDIPAWCRMTGNELVESDSGSRPKRFVIRKKS